MEGTQGTGPTGPAGFLEELRRPYKDGQGEVTRRIAYWTGVGFVVWGAFDLWVWLQGFGGLQKALFPDPLFGGAVDLSRLPLGGPALSTSVVIAAIIGAAGWIWVSWFLRRPWLADLLIETESEMKKVSWPAKEEAWSATKVVSVTVLLFTLVLLVFDFAITAGMKLLTGLPL